MALPMGRLKIDNAGMTGTSASAFSDHPTDWAPPPAPLDMPHQELERQSTGSGLLSTLRFFLMGQRI